MQPKPGQPTVSVIIPVCKKQRYLPPDRSLLRGRIVQRPIRSSCLRTARVIEKSLHFHELTREYMRENPHVRLLDNPRRKQRGAAQATRGCCMHTYASMQPMAAACWPGYLENRKGLWIYARETGNADRLYGSAAAAAAPAQGIGPASLF